MSWLPDDWLSQAVDLVVGISWPIALVIGLMIFKNSLRELLSRLVRVGKEGAEFEPAPQSSNAKPPQQEDTQFAKPPEHPDPRIQPYVQYINRWVREKLDEAANLFRLDRETILVQAIGEYVGALHLERAYQSIFGSQLDALLHLQRVGGKDKRTSIKNFYLQAAAKYSSFYMNYSFEQWLQYLTNWELVELSGEDVILTSAGMAFIPHIESRGLSLTKLG